ncbi:MAG: ATP phosphoribosyltransferase regulatory subunit [Hyphomicrobiaceae bacterium]|nr:ATP phosphoribosyltransferase regulatory subunit [Hyphomicrobiaceae bacterium]MCC0022986.1 ATP phosphoribosyltransferase regulatory subunit [Hyphomicrobiaceae bacterium]
MPTVADIARKLGAVLDTYVPERTEPDLLVPANDYFELAGEEFGRRLMLTTGVDGHNYCLRPDFTLPVAQGFLRNGSGGAASFGYWGKVFRQRSDGPAEFTQMGLELLGHADADDALDKVLRFVVDSLEAAELTDLTLTFGSVALFEALLRGADIPEVWVPRLRHRFGNPVALDALLLRLGSAPAPQEAGAIPDRTQLIAEITEQMLTDGLSLTEGRTPAEIADRFIEKRELEAARVPHDTLGLLKAFLSISGGFEHAVAEAARLCAEHDIDVAAPIDTLRRHAARLTDFAPNIALSFAAGFAPRLHYYTGLVFEVRGQGTDVLASGGQYDRLLSALGADREIPASGAAIWVERIGEAANV